MGKSRYQAAQKQKQKPLRRRLLRIGLTLAGLAVVGILLVNHIQQTQGGVLFQTAPSGEIGTRVGDTAPDFRLRDIDGTIVTRSSLLADKPGLVYFTATWCPRCIPGLRGLAKFEQGVGGDPFRVLIVFVDPRETDDDLRAFRQRFAFPMHWHYALDRDEMVVKYRVRNLSTGFVLDRAGVIQFAHFRPDSYATWVRAWGTVGVSP
jgi:peroxiredoxin